MLSAGFDYQDFQSVLNPLSAFEPLYMSRLQILILQPSDNISDGTVQDYISLTDIARYKTNDTFIVIGNWMRNRNTIEYLGIWESLYNPDFKPIEFDRFKKEVGLNAFTLSPQKWIEATAAIGIVSKSGRYGGTFAHKDIAFKFASWISVEFELYVVKEFQRLKEQEQAQLGWSAKRELSKINYRIHTDAKGNVRDHATINELICLSNMENLNAVFSGGAVAFTFCHARRCVERHNQHRVVQRLSRGFHFRTTWKNSKGFKEY